MSEKSQLTRSEVKENYKNKKYRSVFQSLNMSGIKKFESASIISNIDSITTKNKKGRNNHSLIDVGSTHYKSILTDKNQDKSHIVPKFDPFIQKKLKNFRIFSSKGFDEKSLSKFLQFEQKSAKKKENLRPQNYSGESIKLTFSKNNTVNSLLHEKIRKRNIFLSFDGIIKKNCKNILKNENQEILSTNDNFEKHEIKNLNNRNILKFEDSEEVDVIQNLEISNKTKKEMRLLLKSESNNLNMNISKEKFYENKENRVNFINDIYKIPHLKNKLNFKVSKVDENELNELPEDERDYQHFLLKLESLKLSNNYDPSTLVFLNFLRKKHQDKLYNDKYAHKELKIDDEITKKIDEENELIKKNQGEFKKYFQYKYENYNSRIKLANADEKNTLVCFSSQEQMNSRNTLSKRKKGNFKSFEAIVRHKIKQSQNINVNTKNLQELKDILVKINDIEINK